MEDTQQEKNLKKKKIIITAVSAILIGAGLFVFHESHYESTDDAYVETTTVNVAPKVSGEIVEVYVEDNQQVKAGDIIAKIDSRDYKIKLEQNDATYTRKILDQKNAEASLNAANIELDNAKKDLERYQTLYKVGAVSKQTLDNATTKYESVKARQKHSQEDILSSGNNVADADLKELKAKRDAAALNLSYTTIYAPQDGTVSAKRVTKGMMVSAGSPLFTLVPNNIWIVANFKETQIGNMKPGMKVNIKIDTYPHHTFKGKIDSIQRSSGAKSSMFPPENAVGSFVKIVQRIPVKIVFDEKIDTSKYTIVPGMSVVPRIKVK